MQRLPLRRKMGSPQMVYFSNLTKLGMKALGHIQALESYALICIAEHHLAGSVLAKYQGKLKKMGLRGSWEQATPTGKGGNTGGTAVLARSHLKISTTTDQAGVLAYPKPSPGKAGWSVAFWHMKGVTVAFVSLYLRCNTGFAGENICILGGLARFLCCLSCPWCILAD